MNKRFAGFLTLGLVIVAGYLYLTFAATEGGHLRLEGKILKVRTMPVAGSDATLVFVDFRVTNPSDVLFVANSAKLQMTPASGAALDGTTISKPEVEKIFQYYKLLGPKYNNVLSLQDRIPPHATLDRMVGARFDAAATAIDSRKQLKLLIEDVDGTVGEIDEKAAAK